eukprot:TRINITY_DN29131_c0_g1_i1.p1 TRINITY_DN29131_c0_g1~~TRINITY_DN29131_c0_g1_i1.p1  ORF type:complete len:259 (-),score=29.89 TRINITY_DN29131_c0_g1_i1:61-837(-)
MAMSSLRQVGDLVVRPDSRSSSTTRQTLSKQVSDTSASMFDLEHPGNARMARRRSAGGTDRLRRFSIAMGGNGAGMRKSVSLAALKADGEAEERCDIAKAILACAHHRDAPQAQLLDLMQDLFDVMDRNKDATVDVDEFVSAQLVLRPNCPPERAVAMFFAADKENLGCIRFETFKKWQVKSWGSMAPASMVDTCTAWISTLKKHYGDDADDDKPVRAPVEDADATAFRRRSLLDAKGAVAAKEHMLQRSRAGRHTTR